MLEFNLVKVAARVLVAVWRHSSFNLQKVTSYNQELLKNICDKRKEIKALWLENSRLQIEKDEAEGKHFWLPLNQFSFLS